MGNKASVLGKQPSNSGSKYQAPPQTADHTLFSHEELKSVRLVALQGPFVDSKTGELLGAFYAQFCPDEDMTDKITTIVESGMEIRMLNEKLVAKYGKDLNTFRQ